MLASWVPVGPSCPVAFRSLSSKEHERVPDSFIERADTDEVAAPFEQLLAPDPSAP